MYKTCGGLAGPVRLLSHACMDRDDMLYTSRGRTHTEHTPLPSSPLCCAYEVPLVPCVGCSMSTCSSASARSCSATAA